MIFGWPPFVGMVAIDFDYNCKIFFEKTFNPFTVLAGFPRLLFDKNMAFQVKQTLFIRVEEWLYQ